MNERINNLRLDAGISTLHDAPYLVAINKSGEIIDPIIGLEKFAELIVAECADWIDGSPSTDAGQLVLSKSFIIANIKEYFGVE